MRNFLTHYPLLMNRLSLLIFASVTGYAETVPSLPTTASARPPVTISSDGRFQQLWAQMKAHAPAVDDLLLLWRVGEAADGYLARLPNVNISTEEISLMQNENAIRRQVYEQMAELTHGSSKEMGEECGRRFSSRLKKGIAREIIASSGTKQWVDGYTDDERIKTYVLEFGSPPPQRVEATKPFTIVIQVRDALGRLAVHPSLAGASFSVASTKPSDGLIGKTTALLESGMAQFADLAYSTVTSSPKLIFKGQGVLAHLKLETPVIAVLEKTFSPEDVETSLPGWERRTERLLNLPSSPSRDRELIDFGRTLERSIASIKSFPMASLLTSQKLQEMHNKVKSALELASPGTPEASFPTQ